MLMLLARACFFVLFPHTACSCCLVSIQNWQLESDWMGFVCSFLAVLSWPSLSVAAAAVSACMHLSPLLPFCLSRCLLPLTLMREYDYVAVVVMQV